MKLACPLCRGQISKWIVVNPAREFMNKKSRSCSMSTCDYSGNYSEIRQHARHDHPRARPTDVDPKRELEWTKLEQDLEQQDMLSMRFEFGVDDDVEVDDVIGDDNEDDDDDINMMDGAYELASPIWDPDMNILNFFSAFEAEFGTFFQELDSVAETSDLMLGDWDEGLDLLPSSPLLRATEIEESGRSRELTNINNLHVPVENARTTRTRANTRGSINNMRMPVENARATRTRANTRGRPRSNAPPSSHNREEQVTTLVDFHELRSSMP
ncbi:uncharacterized protein LOC143585989 [Bidens hawaiensis]|uniref:uncharacterized protein LOC143585989 n=1 Tax=Bidens hawaiensis TaxID=980011 RepID=UPI00404A225D